MFGKALASHFLIARQWKNIQNTGTMSGFGRQPREPFPARARTNLTVSECNQTEAKKPAKENSDCITGNVFCFASLKSLLVFHVEIKSLHLLHSSVVLTM